ncbi:MAG: 3-phosphoshikimate 1-carboxyvinyltransferase [Bacteroidota bacterium]
MRAKIKKYDGPSISGKIQVTGSKSESNRLLILQALYPNLTIRNLSNSDDSVVLAKGLTQHTGMVDIHHAGTAMRFLTAYFASQEGRDVVLTGSKRMQERPIGVLVDALRQLGADITYETNEGFPPLRIRGKKLMKSRVSVQADMSSQYISALMLIASSLPNGLKIELEGKVTSVPYIEMTLSLLHRLGIQGDFKENVIAITSKESIADMELTVESDWSSASYFYSIASLTRANITLGSYRQESLQGDSKLTHMAKELLGVSTGFDTREQTMELRTYGFYDPKTTIELDLSDTPDIAQTIAVARFGMGYGCHLTGLHTLKIKETDRLVALKTELEKLGARVDITADSLTLYPSEEIKQDVTIDTYNDHRMAMAFAPLALRVPMIINDAEVVSKSFPTFWDDLKLLGFEIELQ